MDNKSQVSGGKKQSQWTLRNIILIALIAILPVLFLGSRISLHCPDRCPDPNWNGAIRK